jgi:hypothetical protein
MHLLASIEDSFITSSNLKNTELVPKFGVERCALRPGGPGTKHLTAIETYLTMISIFSASMLLFPA